MSSQSDHEETQDETSSQGDFQQRNEDWDDIFRGKGQSLATSDLFGQVDADSIQKEASAYFTPLRKRKSNEINDQTLNTQEFLNNIRNTEENSLTYTTKEEVLEYHGISADLRSTTIRMKGKRLLGTALGETNLPTTDIRMILTHGTGQISTNEDSFYTILPADIIKTNSKREPLCWLLTTITMFYAKNISNPNFELSNKGQPIKPDTTVNPDSLPMNSSLITEFYNWLNNFQEFCKRHCPKA